VDVTRDDWRRVKAIAAAALEVAPDSRLEYIASRSPVRSRARTTGAVGLLRVDTCWSAINARLF
jgi:hypothetical protein